ncbi:MAG: MFS transporter, partial [Coriobacteriia bacterium]|nr:MFS transporter [Coriobacteriia bacterium]
MTARSKNLLILALALAMFLAAVEGTIVTLAIPTIAKDLSGFDLISWVFSAYLFASAVSTPIFGKLCDLFGRKRMLIIGILIFIIGSASCGLSQSMHMLIAFRVLQGIGAGAIFTVPSTIVGDTFPLDQRGKVQGALSVVWGIASLVGPFLGGMLIAVLSWHWIFFINVPIGLVSVIVLQRVFDEQFERRRQPIIPHGI